MSADVRSLPNVVFFTWHDAGDWFRCYGHRMVHTPNVDRLAACGVRFDSCYSACAICLPSRAAMMTGQLCQRNGVMSLANTVFDNRIHPHLPHLAARFKKLGYRSALFGVQHEAAHEHVAEISQVDEQFATDPWPQAELQIPHVRQWIADRAREDRPFYAQIGTGEAHLNRFYSNKPARADEPYPPVQDTEHGLAMPGYLAGSEAGRATVATLQGWSSPVVNVVSDLRREGGGAFLARFDDVVYFGPTEFGILRFRVGPPPSETPTYRGMEQDPKRKIRGAMTGLAGWRVGLAGNTAYFLRHDELTALPYDRFRNTLQDSAQQFGERLKARKITTKSGVQLTTDAVAEEEMAGCAKWKAAVKGGRSLVVAGNLVIVGAENAVVGFDPASGAEKFRADVDGTAWEMAAADGMLYVSTSAGKLYCFGGKPEELINAPIMELSSEPLSRYAAAALKKAGRLKGYCVIVGAGEGRLAREIARQSEMRVVCVERNPDGARQARENLLRAGVYGKRVVVHVRPDGKLPYAQHFANLIVSESMATAGTLDFAPADVAGLLEPYGGALVLTSPGDAAGTWGRSVPGWKTASADGLSLAFAIGGELPGAGDWTHMFADPANTSNSGDTLVGGTQYRLQWFGDPSPPKNAGWHANGIGPLAKDGRLFMLKINHIEAVDAYNGTSLWGVGVPGMERFSPGREGGSACVDEKNLFVAVKHDCQVLDVVTSNKVRSFVGPDEKSDWGFIAVQGRYLLGTKQNPAATLDRVPGYKDPLGLRGFWNASEAEFVVSTSVFALDKTTGALIWNYAKPDRVIVNSTVTTDGRRVYFVESRNKDIVGDPDGSVLLRHVTAGGAHIVALDLATGKPVWEQPFQLNARTMLYLSVIDDTLVASAGYNTGPLADLPPMSVATSAMAKTLNMDPEEAKTKIAETRIRFAFQALDANSGKAKWTSEYTSSDVIGTQHNYNVSHPVITKTAIYHNPAEQYLAIIDLRTGAIKERKDIARGKGCATPTGSGRSIFYRSLGISAYDFESGRQFFVSDVSRPSCWMNVLPAGGLLLMPEYSIGCNCAFPLQTTIVLAPGKYEFEPDATRNTKPTGRGND